MLIDSSSYENVILEEDVTKLNLKQNLIKLRTSSHVEEKMLSNSV